MGNSYGQVQRLKALLTVTTTDTDSMMLDLLERTSRFIDDFTGQLGKGFYVTQATRYFDGSRARQDIDLLLTLARIDIDPILTITSLATDPGGDGVFEETWVEGVGQDFISYPLNVYPKFWLACTISTRYGMFARGIPSGVKIVGAWGWGDGLRANPVDDTGSTVGAAGWATIFPYTFPFLFSSTLSVTNASLLSVGMTLLVGTEQVYVTARDTGANTITADRGVNGTTPAAHTAGDHLYVYRYPSGIEQATYMQAARWWRRKDTAYSTMLGSPLMGPYEVYQGLDPDVQRLLTPYVPIKAG